MILNCKSRAFCEQCATYCTVYPIGSLSVVHVHSLWKDCRPSERRTRLVPLCTSKWYISNHAHNCYCIHRLRHTTRYCYYWSANVVGELARPVVLVAAGFGWPPRDVSRVGLQYAPRINHQRVPGETFCGVWTAMIAGFIKVVSSRGKGDQGHSNNTAGIVWGFVCVVQKNSLVLLR